MPVGGGPTGMPGCMSGGGCSGAPAGGAPGVIMPGMPGMGGGPGMPSGGGAPARSHQRRLPVSKEPWSDAYGIFGVLLAVLHRVAWPWRQPEGQRARLRACSSLQYSDSAPR